MGAGLSGQCRTLIDRTTKSTEGFFEDLMCLGFSSALVWKLSPLVSAHRFPELMKHFIDFIHSLHLTEKQNQTVKANVKPRSCLLIVRNFIVIVCLLSEAIG